VIPLRQIWSLLREYLAAHRDFGAVLGVLMLAAAGLQLLQPVMMARFIDSAVRGASSGLLTATALT
jgi:hypothetical protein